MKMKYTRNIIIASGMVQAILIAQLFIPASPEALLRFEYISNGENKIREQIWNTAQIGKKQSNWKDNRG